MFKSLDAEGRDAPLGRIKNKNYNNRSVLFIKKLRVKEGGTGGRERSECPPV